MEPTLASLYPIHQIGSDGFNWWVGQIESNKGDDPKKSGRYRVRIIGQHLKDCDSTKTEDLPWASVMMPVTAPFTDGLTSGASVGLEQGNWVIGFYLDNDRQKPIIMGSIGHTKGSTIVKNDDPTPGKTCKSFTTFISNDVVPQQDYPVNSQTGKNKDGANVALAGPPATDNGNIPGEIPPAVAAAMGKRSETNPTGSKHCYVVANPKCGNESNLKNSIEQIIGDLLKANQDSGGQLGNYLVSKANGFLYDKVNIARYHIGRVVNLVKSFIARVKGEIVKVIKDGVNKLIDTFLKAEDAEGAIIGNTGPLADPEKAFKPIREKGNRLKKVKKIFDKIFEELGCTIEDATDRIAQWLFDTIFGYLTDIFYEAACVVDTLINGILNQILDLVDQIINTVLAPIQELLDAIASPLNIISNAINSVMSLLGISCSGPKQDCEPIQKICTDCTQNDNEDDKDFLDKLISDIENGPLDSGGGICDEATELPPEQDTEVYFVGGVFEEPPAETVSEPSSSDITPPEFLSSDPDEEIDTESTDPPDDYPEIIPSVPDDDPSKIPTDEVTLPDEENTEEIFFDIKTNKEVYKEGETIVYTIKSINVVNNTKVFYTLSGVGIEQNDIVEGLTGSFTVNNNQATVTITLASEGIVDDIPKQLKFKIDSYNAFKDVIIDSNFVLIPGIDDDIIKLPSYVLTTDKTSYNEGEDIICIVEATNVEVGTTLDYTLFGSNISKDDFINNSLVGKVIINEVDNKLIGKFVLGIQDDTKVENQEELSIILNGTGIVATVVIKADEKDVDIKPSQPTETPKEPAIKKPVAGVPITDDNGSIISIPIKDKGDPYQKEPKVIIGGKGYGATAIALLDENGYVSEIRVTRTGVNYKVNKPDVENVSCIIDSFTLLSPGVGYTSPPKVYIDGESGLAEALINERGYVYSVRILDRTRTYTKMPKVLIIGGEGAGARALPNISCIDTIELERRGYAKIGTGKYIDCP